MAPDPPPPTLFDPPKTPEGTVYDPPPYREVEVRKHTRRVPVDRPEGPHSLPGESQPRARSDDSDTSKTAAASSNPTKLQAYVLRALKHERAIRLGYGSRAGDGWTDEQIREYLIDDAKLKASPSGLRTARVALERADFVRKSDSGVTPSGRPANTFTITAAGKAVDIPGEYL